MRIWTVHPRYLDRQGLLASWREALLAQKVLRGLTCGYKAHPQLERFRCQRDPVAAIGSYLSAVHDESLSRGYSFDRSKIFLETRVGRIVETDGQLEYEWGHLLSKLKKRDGALYSSLKGLEKPEPHPLFRIVRGGIRSWERIQ